MQKYFSRKYDNTYAQKSGKSNFNNWGGYLLPDTA